ncbi:MAG: ThiF family adenylyltransferase [Bdellovibrionaceae bacterium]|nr:ThiF family adenylyltransferase [Pseudobdellovibrionaceae bacterium]
MDKNFEYSEAFCRNLGWVTKEELKRLGSVKVAIGGAGGVGGIHLITLVRLGITQFHLADPDFFEMKNFNRQYGADMNSLGKNKCDVMLEKALAINPELKTKSFKDGITKANVAEFLDGVDIYVDGIDVFEIETREFLYPECRKRGIPCVSVAPVGMGASIVNFTPDSMTFENYFGVQGKTAMEKIIRFTLGVAPSLVHLKSLIAREYSNITERRVSSTPMGCHMASGVMGTEVLKLLLNRGPVTKAPKIIHFDGYTYKVKKTNMFWGHRNPIFKIKLILFKWIASRLPRKLEDSKV